MDVAADQPTVKEMLARMDDGWTAFSRRVHDLPVEMLDVRLGEDAWTRKQMLAHIATWHDLTVDRLGQFADTGQPVELDDDDDTINARAARASIGRTTGEVLLALDESYRRLRREVAHLTNEQLAAHNSWAAAVISGNTNRHYAEHAVDLDARIPVT
ncbi:MAG TPA: DinB family protein [Candidatus Limnocylindrales bacterium]|nr:DinB family protein [Candidatus Limnocylindrales bacterium]